MLSTLHECRKVSEDDILFPAYLYVCDCKAFQTNAFFCSHAIACLHLDGDIEFDIFTRTQGISGSKPKRGRPRKVKENCLTMDKPSSTHDHYLHIHLWDSVFMNDYGVGIVDQIFSSSTPTTWRILFSNLSTDAECTICNDCEKGSMHLLLNNDEVSYARKTYIDSLVENRYKKQRSHI